MTQIKPRLVTFRISHFCEKARWALNWHGITHQEISWPPGVHRILAKRCGAKANTLPILLDGETVIQGSGAIIDWAESKAQDLARSLTPRANAAEAQEIERRADAVIGVHVRRLAFAAMLPRHSHLLKRALFQRASGCHPLVGNMMWPATRGIIMRMYDIRSGAASESRSKLEAELDWLDNKLADGRTYLAGDRFSRADLTVASLLATFARPEETPIYRDLEGPDLLAADVERWRKRPVMRWVIAQYRAHREQSSSGYIGFPSCAPEVEYFHCF